MADIRQKAVATARAYQQGNIATLDDAMTRRLIASTVMSESHGGDFDATNRLGFVGRYKAGAEFLAVAGYVDRDKLGQAMTGHKSEWAWAKSGAMAAFLQDTSHWNSGFSLDAYRQSPELQDLAFKRNAEKHHQRAVEQGVLGVDEKPSRIAGFLKAAHIVGFNSAREAMTGGRAYRDANGVSNYDRIHDISRNGDGLEKLMTAERLGSPQISTANTVADAEHPEHGRYRAIYAALEAVPGLCGDRERQQAAASIMVATRAADMRSVDHVVAGPGGTIFAVQGNMHDVAHKILSLNLAELVAQPIERSTAQLGALASLHDTLAGADLHERARAV
jgi:hypothetical protein